MVCFDEARYMSDNFDEEIVDIVNSLRNADQPLATYLAMLSMQGLNLQPDSMTTSDFTATREEFHLNMAIVMDLSFAIFAEKRFLLYEDYNDQTSPVNIIKLSQTLSSFTDPNLWQTPEKRYQAYGVSSMRKYLSFGCFRNYSLGMQAFKDIYLACLSLNAPVFAILLTELSSLMDTATDLDLRWANQAILNDCIIWCMKMGEAQKTNSDLQEYWSEFF